MVHTSCIRSLIAAGVWLAHGDGVEQRGEFGQDVLECSCRGDAWLQGQCNFHLNVAFGGTDRPWCRTKYGCGTWSLLGSWSYCDPAGVERRRAAHGTLQTRQEFQVQYGTDGTRAWVAAGCYPEKRAARDGVARSIHEFRAYYIDSLGERGWLMEWQQFKPEQRTARDGKQYSWDEFVQHYGLDAAWKKWDDAGETKVEGVPVRVQETFAKLVHLHEGTYPDAVCLDGSRAGYYLRKGTSDKYLIFFQGGGWCYHRCESPSREGTLSDCRDRSKSRLGSSKSWYSTMDDGWLRGMLSSKQKVNPVFYDWTLVYVPYCDGMSLSGNAVVDGLYFKGQVILDSVIDDLLRTTDIRSAEQVVVSGGSAGASAVFWRVDQVAEQLALQNGEVVALPDAGLFLDVCNKDGVDCWPKQIRSILEVANATGSLNKRCRQKFRNEQWKCVFPQYYLDVLDIRTFVVNSLYDSSEITYSLCIDCCFRWWCRACDKKEIFKIRALHEGHIKAVSDLTDRADNGVWMPACVEHTMGETKWTDQSWAVPAGSGNTMAKVVQNWLAKKDVDGHQFKYVDDVHWPDNHGCA